MTRKHTVIGAGHGGKAMAAHLALMGFSVTLFNRTAAHIEIIKKRGGIELDSTEEGGPHGFGKLAKVTSDIGEAIKHAEIIQVVLPSSAHADIAAAAAPHLKDGQTVLLHPGRTCGALEFAKVMRDHGCKADVTVAEAETFIYASRSDGPAQARIFRIKEAVPLAALPAVHTQKVLDVICEAYPQFIDGVNVLNTGLNNMGAIFHPALTLLNMGWIEATHGDYQFYIDGVTPSVARVLEVLDRERVTVASSLGIRARTSLEWLKLAYDTEGEDLHEAIHNQPGYYGIKAPPTLHHRYIFEDVPVGVSLSGGLDSSIVSLLACEGADQLHSFVVGVEGSEDLAASRKMANILQTQHHELIYNAEDMARALPDVLYYLETFDPALVRSAIPNYFLAKLASQYVKVFLTGEGADEVYAGYDYLGGYDSPETLQEEMIHITEALHNTNLQRADRMSMAFGLEARVPFLDVRSIALALSFPPEWKLHRGRVPKALLRKAFAADLPAEIVNRPKQKFSKGAGSSDLIAQRAEAEIPDDEFQRESHRLKDEWDYSLQNKEALYYYKTLRTFFDDKWILPTTGKSRSL